jgi:hypothetical protein
MNPNPQANAEKTKVEQLLESSKAQGRQSLLMPMFLLGVLVASLYSLRGGNPLLEAAIPVVFAGSIVVAVLHAARIARRQQKEKDALRQIDESIRLGNWAQAASAVEQFLGKPVMLPQVRVQGLIYLGAVLVRQGQYQQVLDLYSYLLETVAFPPQIAISLRCVRVYAMLREEHLSDAYQAISQLKRDTPGGSAMLSLLELYRLVKMGHPDDALQLFGQKWAQLAEQLGHRSCDGWALAAAAALAMGREQEADGYARNAGLLGDVREIGQRFPECRGIMDRIWPAEVQVQPS